MMATVGPSSSCSFLPLLESLEDRTAGQSEQIDAYLTIAKYVPVVGMYPPGVCVNIKSTNYCEFFVTL